MLNKSEKIAVIGLGYVGLPVAVALAKKHEMVVGFDISSRRIAALRAFNDWTHEISTQDLRDSTMLLTTEPKHLDGCSFFIVTVPTPIDQEKRPDLSPLAAACEFIGPYLKQGTIVVFESTVYPGVTEDFCGPLLEKYSGLKQSVDFTLGYSPERINPGDTEHRLENITKIIAAEDDATLARVKAVYGAIIKAGLYEANSIRVAEAAKVLENTQRDINIALMNELAIIMERIGVRTRDVLDAAATKWNFLKFAPGLVGGHCIGVDPYYLTSLAESLGYHPQVILAGRRLNDDMAAFVATKTIKMLVGTCASLRDARVGILGLTFKENVPDLRNSKVPGIIRELASFGVKVLVHDPLASSEMAMEEYRVEFSDLKEFQSLDALILAVNHHSYISNASLLFGMLKPNGVLVDIKSALKPADIPLGLAYWSL